MLLQSRSRMNLKCTQSLQPQEIVNCKSYIVNALLFVILFDLEPQSTIDHPSTHRAPNQRCIKIRAERLVRSYDGILLEKVC